MKVAAVTGANGFLGSYLVKECLSQGMRVYALIRKGANTSLLPNHDGLFLRHVEYNHGLDEQFTSFKNEIGHVDYFLHNAGLTVSLKNQEYYDINVDLTKTIISALEKSQLLKTSGSFIYTSSYAANGPASINTPVSHYGRSKLQAEQAIIEGVKNYLIARPTAIYGSGDQAFLPLFKGAKMGIYPVSDSTQRMSMIHAKDLANMIVTDMQGQKGILHYSDGTTYYHSDFIQDFESILQKKVRVLPLPKWLVKASMALSDFWHKLIKKRPGITLEKFDEISQHWDLHSTDLPHSSVKSKISLKEGFQDALSFYKKNNLI